jgi:hypothetical protein
MMLTSSRERKADTNRNTTILEKDNPKDQIHNIRKQKTTLLPANFVSTMMRSSLLAWPLCLKHLGLEGLSNPSLLILPEFQASFHLHQKILQALFWPPMEGRSFAKLKRKDGIGKCYLLFCIWL